MQRKKLKEMVMGKVLRIVSIVLIAGVALYTIRQITYKKSAYKRESNAANMLAVKNGKQLLQPGMIVFRRGADGISDLFCRMNQKDRTYSHCGIVKRERDSMYIYHSIGGEDNPNQKIKKESFEVFVHPKNNLSFGIITLPFTTSEKMLLDSIVQQWYREERTFDMDFELNNDERKLYCVEFLYKAIQLAKHDSTYFTTSKAKDLVYVAPDDILLHKEVERVLQVEYK